MTQDDKLTKVFDKRAISIRENEVFPNEDGSPPAHAALIGATGVLIPMEFVKYGTYNGGNSTEFICEVFSIDDHMSILTQKELDDLRNEVINASTLSQDGFITERIVKYDFDTNNWVDAPEHLGQTSNTNYFFYDNNDEFLTLLSDEIERHSAAEKYVNACGSNVTPEA